MKRTESLFFLQKLTQHYKLTYFKIFLIKKKSPHLHKLSVQFSCSVVSDSATPWTMAHQASLSITSSRSLNKLMSIELVMPSNRLILCHPFLLLSWIFPSIRVFSNESFLYIRWPKKLRCGQRNSLWITKDTPRALKNSKEFWSSVPSQILGTRVAVVNKVDSSFPYQAPILCIVGLPSRNTMWATSVILNFLGIALEKKQVQLILIMYFT